MVREVFFLSLQVGTLCPTSQWQRAQTIPPQKDAPRRASNRKLVSEIVDSCCRYTNDMNIDMCSLCSEFIWHCSGTQCLCANFSHESGQPRHSLLTHFHSFSLMRHTQWKTWQVWITLCFACTAIFANEVAAVCPVTTETTALELKYAIPTCCTGCDTLIQSSWIQSSAAGQNR